MSSYLRCIWGSFIISSVRSSVNMDVSCFPKGTPAMQVPQPLNKWSFTLPGMGFAADYCMKPKVSGLSVDPGKALRISRLKCNRTQCPNCYEWWISERVFDIAVKLECYSVYTGDRPSAITCSEHPDAYRDRSWDDYNRSFRRLYRRVKKLGIQSAYRVFHPYRVRKECKKELSSLGYAKGSSGYWKGVRDDALGYGSLHDYVNLAPHLHLIAFPSYIEPNDDSGIFVKKYGNLSSVNDVVAHCRYLLSHCGVLADDDSNEPTQPIGALYGWNAEAFLTVEQIQDIKIRVADAMGLFYDVDQDKVAMIDEEPEGQEEKIDFYGMYRFLNYSLEQSDFIGSYIASCSDPGVSSYIEMVIDRYNRLMSDSSLPDSEQHIFFDSLPDPPKKLGIIYDYGING